MNLKRLIVERIDNRILVGTVAFLAIIVLVGWVWINENGRMAAFEEQFTARSIERGAALFAVNCSTCHGLDGRGIIGRAPGLNSPYLFSHDYLAEVNATLESLNAQRNTAINEGTSTADIDAQIAAATAERDALIAQMQPAVNVGYDPEQPSRLVQVGWASTVGNFIASAITSGRPTSSSYWPQAMPAWSQEFGGPYRADQIIDLRNYVLNWDKGPTWTIDDLNAVNQFPIYPIDPASANVSTEPTVGTETPIDEIMAGLSQVTGDPQAGQIAYTGAQLGCIGCHGNAAVAPPTAGTWTRVETVRLTEPQFAGYTGQEYLAESIIHPTAYTVPNYPSGVMPPNFGDRLTYQDLANLIAFLETQDQPAQ